MASGKLCCRGLRLLHAHGCAWACSAHLYSRPAPCLGVKDQNIIKAYASHGILQEHDRASTSKHAHHPASTLTGKDAMLAAIDALHSHLSAIQVHLMANRCH